MGALGGFWPGKELCLRLRKSQRDGPGLLSDRRGSDKLRRELVDLRFAAGETALAPPRKVAEGRSAARWKALGEAHAVVPGPKRWLGRRASQHDRPHDHST